MSINATTEIVPGSVLEFFEDGEILVCVCMTLKGQRMTVLTEHNRELGLSFGRVIHIASKSLDPRLGRDELVRRLQETTALRKSFMLDVNTEELWELLEEEGGNRSAAELAEYVFSSAIIDHHVAAVQRVLLGDRLYFRHKDGAFQPRPRDKVEQLRSDMEREAERERRLAGGSEWLESVWNKKNRSSSLEGREDVVRALKNYGVFGPNSPELAFVRELFRRAGIPLLPQSAFRMLVRLGVWHEDENLHLIENDISVKFPAEAERLADGAASSPFRFEGDNRRDLRHLHTVTIDGAQTRDFDDALSVETPEEGIFEVGIHIADTAEYVRRGDPVDAEAEDRATSIYLPDAMIPMLPAALSEDVCSLKAGKERPVLSFLLRLNASGEILSSEIVPAVVTIREQLTYEEVNERIAAGNAAMVALHDLAGKLRARRIADGAVILPLPEIMVRVNGAGMIRVSKYEKETPSQITVSEWMIAANALAGRFLAEREIPAIFRSQGECKPETDFTQSEHEIFKVYRQRRLFARAELDTKPKPHCSLAIQHYTTVTSPIRRYFDLVVQRQLKEALASGKACYSEEELKTLLMKLGTVQGKVSQIQRKWTRYWILKYMEQESPFRPPSPAGFSHGGQHARHGKRLPPAGRTSAGQNRPHQSERRFTAPSAPGIREMIVQGYRSPLWP